MSNGIVCVLVLACAFLAALSGAAAYGSADSTQRMTGLGMLIFFGLLTLVLPTLALLLRQNKR